MGGGNESETVTLNRRQEASLSESLTAARERRGLSREAVVNETHIPAHYLGMLEDGDYRLISDQLYLLPFLRKYARFLELDQEETAMRLVREVQRVDHNPPPVRIDEPVDDVRRRWRRNWTQPAIFSGLIAVIIGAYIAQSRHDDADSIPPPIVQSSAAAPASPPVRASRAATSSTSVSRSPNANSISRSDSLVPHESITGARTEGPRVMQSSPNQPMVVPVVVPDAPPQLARIKAPNARRVPTPANR